jgi:hypothetical protein
MDAAVVWVADAPPGGVDAKTRQAVEQWARAHGVTMAVVDDGVDDLGTVRADPALARGVDDELTRARDALSALEIDAAERALARAEATLRAHPELPQAAWLLAEVERGWSARWLRGPAPDETRASRAWQRAASLDGGRAPGVGERAFAPSVSVDATLALESAEAEPRGEHGVTLRLDGAAVAAGPIARGEGIHQLTVLRDGAPVWSSWITLAAGAVVRVPVPPPPPCSSRDLARASIDGDEVRATAVRCPRWTAVARARTFATLRIARCADGRCDPLAPQRTDEAPLAEPPPLAPRAAGAADAERSRHWPAWATWTLVGVAAAAVTTAVVLVASGAFASPPVETRFVNGGVRPAGFAF